MKTIRTWTSPDGTRTVEIYDREDGFYSFSEMVLMFEDMSDIGQESFSYLSPVHDSGLYASVDEAERDAVAMASWLTNATS